MFTASKVNTGGLNRSNKSQSFSDRLSDKCNDRGALISIVAAQIYHSCDRNASEIISKEMKHITYAVKPIKKGELVCIPYRILAIQINLFFGNFFSPFQCVLSI